VKYMWFYSVYKKHTGKHNQ